MTDIFLIHGGVKYTVKSGNVNDFHNNLPAIKGDIGNMKATHSGLQQKSFSRPGKWDIKEVFGDTSVKIYGGEEIFPTPSKEDKRKEPTTVSMLVPYLRAPDGNGILLNTTGLNFDGPFVRFAPYGDRAYPPWIWPITEANDMPHTLGTTEPGAEPVPEDGETLLEFTYKTANELAQRIPESILGKLNPEHAPLAIVSYEELPFCGGNEKWAPMLYDTWADMNAEWYPYIWDTYPKFVYT